MAEVRSPKQINADGTVNVHCVQCGNFICRTQYRGFTSATCEFCATGKISPLAVPGPDVEASLYNTDEEAREEKVGLVSHVFRALGFGRPKGAEPEAQSEAVAKRKKRRGLLSNPDAEDGE